MAQPSKGKATKEPKHLDTKKAPVVSANDHTGIVPAKSQGKS